MKPFRIFIFLGLLILALLLVRWLFFGSKETTPVKNGKSKGPLNATVWVVKSQNVERDIYISGTLLGGEVVNLQPETAGKITEIRFSEGSQVAKGQLLVQLNNADLLAQYRKINSQIVLAEIKEQRLRQLLTIQGVSKEEYESALNTLEGLKADADGLQAQIDKMAIRAPFSGTIGLRNVSVGSYVSNNTIIATLVQMLPAKIDFTVPEKYATQFSKGSGLSFSADGQNNWKQATVYAIDPSADLNSRSIHVRASTTALGNAFLSGTFVRIRLNTGTNQKALMLPTECIVPDVKGQKVFVLRNGLCQAQAVVTGIRTDSFIEITEGLVAGDTVLATGLLQAKPGQTVKIQKVMNP